MLFDDLPQAKNDAIVTDQKKPASLENISNDNEGDNTKSNISEEKKSKSLVNSLGKAGTSMAFVPAALRKRKTPMATSSSKSRKQVANRISVKPSTSCTHQSKPTFATSEIISNSCEKDCEEKEKASHQEERNMHVNVHVHVIPSSSEPMQAEYKEPQHLTDLHASIRLADLYTPMMPNDYLAYRQRKENDMMNANLQKQAEKTLEMQKKLRDQIEDERQKAIDSGDVGKIIESRLKNVMDGVGLGGMGRGRGRGRGLNNLPAWLVKKQQEQKSRTKSL